jgi:5'-3' exonuclease
LGDKIDNVIGLTDVVPGFGRKTALKLLIKHGSLENLLNVAAKRTVGKPYVHEALVKYESILRKNLEVLRLRW